MVFDFDSLGENIKPFLTDNTFKLEIFFNHYIPEFQRETFLQLKEELSSYFFERKEYKVKIFDNGVRIKSFLYNSNQDKEVKDKEVKEKEVKEKEIKDKEKEVKDKDKEVKDKDKEVKDKEVKEKEIKDKDKEVKEKEIKDKDKEVKEKKTIVKIIKSKKYNYDLVIFKKENIDITEGKIKLVRLITRDIFKLEKHLVILSDVTQLDREEKIIQARKYEIKILINKEDTTFQEINDFFFFFLKLFLGSNNIYTYEELINVLEQIRYLALIDDEVTYDKLNKEIMRKYFYKPKDLKKEHFLLQLVPENLGKFYLSIKLDGILRLMFLNKDGIWILTFNRINFYSKSDKYNFIPSIISNMLIFVEEMNDGKYYIIEAITFNNLLIVDEEFSKKIVFFEKISSIFEGLIQNKKHYLVKTASDFVKAVDKLIALKDEIKSDGIIITFEESRRGITTLKWKENKDLTIDLEYRRGEKYLLSKEKEPVSEIEIDFSDPIFSKILDGTILELEYVNDKFQVRKIRYDKIEGNSYYVIRDILKNIKDPLSKEDITFRTDKIFNFILENVYSPISTKDNIVFEDIITFLDRDFLEQLLLINNRQYKDFPFVKKLDSYLSWRELYFQLKEQGYVILNERNIKDEFLLTDEYNTLLRNITQLEIAKRENIYQEIVVSKEINWKRFELDLDKDFPQGFDSYSELTKDEDIKLVNISTPQDCYNLLHALLNTYNKDYWESDFIKRRNLAKELRKDLNQFLTRKDKGYYNWERIENYVEMFFKELHQDKTIKKYSLESISSHLSSREFLNIDILELIRLYLKNISIFLLRKNSLGELEGEKIYLNPDAEYIVFLLHYKCDNIDIFETVGIEEKDLVYTCFKRDDTKITRFIETFFWKEVFIPKRNPKKIYLDLFLKNWKYILSPNFSMLKYDSLFSQRMEELKDYFFEQLKSKLLETIKRMPKKEIEEFYDSIMLLNKDFYNYLTSLS